MKLLISILLFSLLCPILNTWAAEQQVNLAGTWILDAKKSDPFPQPLRNLGAPQMGGSSRGEEMDGGGRGSTPAGKDPGGGMPGDGMGGGIPGGGTSRFGRGPQPTAQNAPMVIEQNETELRISRTGSVMGKETPVLESYLVDGAEHTQMNQLSGAPDPVKVVTSAKLKKNSLLVRITIYNPKNKTDVKREFALSKDGKTLTVKSQNTTPTGVMVQDQVYHRQE
jgi:hypothetical protein